MKVWTTEDLEGLPDGSCLQNCTIEIIEGIPHYVGLWCSMAGSYTECAPVEFCTDVDPDEEMRLQLQAFFETPEGKAHLAEYAAKFK